MACASAGLPPQSSYSCLTFRLVTPYEAAGQEVLVAEVSYPHLIIPILTLTLNHDP